MGNFLTYFCFVFQEIVDPVADHLGETYSIMHLND
jgi:hypothetical protein